MCCSLLLTHAVCVGVAGSIHGGLSLVQLRSEKLGSSSAAQSEDGDAADVDTDAARVRSSNENQPHIVIVLLDDLGWNNIGYHNESVKTPFMDEFARDGVILDRYYSGAICAPSRFSLLTGRNAWHSEAFGSGNMNEKLPIGTSPDYTMLPAALKKVGYETHIVGKWHQGFHEAAYTPTNRGFDTFFGIHTGDTDHFSQRKPTCDFGGLDLMEDENPYVIDNDEVLGDYRYRNRAVQLILSHNRSKPMFLYLSLQFPHSPYQVTEAYSSMYNFQGRLRNVYYGMISHTDDTVKEVVGALKQNSMYSNSIVVVMSDNGADSEGLVGGERFGSETILDGNYPLRMGKGSVFEGGIRVPAFVNGGYLTDSARGQIREELVSVSDWFATLADLAGAEKPNNVPVVSDSINMWPYISGKVNASPRQTVVQMSVRFDTGQMEVALINGTWKFMLGRAECKLSQPCLFDLKNDPNEEKDVSGSHTSVASVMSHEVNKLIEAAKSSAWFGWSPKGGIDGGVELFLTKRCKVSGDAKGYHVPWADSADEEDFLRGGHKLLTID